MKPGRFPQTGDGWGIGHRWDHPRRRRFVCYFHFVGWDCWSLGFHVCTSAPNIELHMPFGFVRVGWNISRAEAQDYVRRSLVLNSESCERRQARAA